MWAYGEAVDLRKGYNGLVGLVENELKSDVMGGDYYLFVNIRRTGCKVLLWDGTTIRQRMSAKLKEVHTELLRRRHLPIPVQGRWLGQVVRGYYAYYSVPTNIHSMQAFRTQVERHWRHALTRRSQRGRPNWERMRRLSARWIPSPRILHPWPTDRFDVTHPR